MLFFFRQRNTSKQCGQITVLFKSFTARSLFAVTSHMLLKRIVLQLKQIVRSVAYLAVLGISQIGLKIRKLRTQGFGLPTYEPISYRKY